MAFGNILASLKNYARSKVGENRTGLHNFLSGEVNNVINHGFDKVVGPKQKVPAKKASPMKKPKAKAQKKPKKR